VIYGIALIFSFISLLLPLSSFWGTIFLIIASLLGLELFVEAIGLVGSHKQPLLNFIKKSVMKSATRDGLSDDSKHNSKK